MKNIWFCKYYEMGEDITLEYIKKIYEEIEENQVNKYIHDYTCWDYPTNDVVNVDNRYYLLNEDYCLFVCDTIEDYD